MSLKQLRDLGVLLPHEEWGAHDLRTTVNKRALGATTALGVAGLALMYVGNGGGVSFVGVGLFLGFMGLITWISLRAVEVQAVRFQEQRKEIREDIAAADDKGDAPEIEAAEGP